MISKLEIRNFKSISHAELALGPMNLFVGTNSSGKSNVLDALRVLQGIGSGFTVSEILNGKPRTATAEVWDAIRGGSEYATLRSATTANGSAAVAIEVEVREALLSGGESFDYKCEFNAQQGKLISESLASGGEPVFDTPARGAEGSPSVVIRYYRKGKRGTKPSMEFERSRPVLQQISENTLVSQKDRATATRCAEVLANAQRLDPSPDMLRQYSTAQSVTRMGERGENFAALVSTIITQDEDRKAFVKWLRELSPADVDDVKILHGALREPLFAVTEHGETFPAPVLSDGTLRFAAIAAAFFQQSMPALLTIEEIEKGVHPSRLRLLVELLRSQTKRLGTQVIATTHSPDVLDWLDDEDLRYTFVAARDADSGISRILPVDQLLKERGVRRETTRLSSLFSEGWLESVQ